MNKEIRNGINIAALLNKISIENNTVPRNQSADTKVTRSQVILDLQIVQPQEKKHGQKSLLKLILKTLLKPFYLLISSLLHRARYFFTEIILEEMRLRQSQLESEIKSQILKSNESVLFSVKNNFTSQYNQIYDINMQINEIDSLLAQINQQLQEINTRFFADSSSNKS